MRSRQPELYVFAISHYCEKARWALDYLSVDYDLRFMAPGEHRKVAARISGSPSSVPYLVADGELISGSSAIIDWAENRVDDEAVKLTPEPGHLNACKEIEQRVDATAGVHIRRYYYSEALVETPNDVRDVFVRDLALVKGLVMRLAWKRVQEVMIRFMDLGFEQGQESRGIVDQELAWIDKLLKDGRTFLVGDCLSRADISVAAILAPLVLPPEHPTYRLMEHPPRMARELEEWRDRASLQWVRQIYAKYRLSGDSKLSGQV